MMLAFFVPSPMELVIVLIIFLLLFGSRVPNIMRSLGKSIPEFKKGLHDDPGTPGDGPAKPWRPEIPRSEIDTLATDYKNLSWSETMLAMFGIGPQELLIVAVIALLLFGKRLPEVARSLGKGIVEFKKGINGVEE
jgi:TatA/E family protein of Tat protein translocase